MSNRYIQEPKTKLQVASPADVASYLLEHVFVPFDDVPQEEMWVMLLDTKNRCRYLAMLYRGTVNTITMRIAEFYRDAVRYNSTAIIIAHCHPSGEVVPSPEDVHLTRKIKEAGELLDVELLDHLIIGKDKYARLDAVLYAGTNFVDDRISIAFTTPVFAMQAMNDLRKIVNATIKFYDKTTVVFSKERNDD